MGERLITPIIIDAPLERIPETRPCFVCDLPAQRTFLSYEVSYNAVGRLAAARSDVVPGYQCGSCDVQFYDLEASIKVLAATLEIVRGAGDKTVAEQLTASLSVGLQRLAHTTTLPLDRII